MAWTAQDRRSAAPEKGTSPFLTDTIKRQLTERYFPRYPTRRAVLLPALHLVQHEYGHIPLAALAEVADFLGLPPAEVLDTASFYEEYWLKPKGKYLIQVCRSLACEICGSRSITDELIKRFGVQPGQTTADGRFTLVELECLGACGGAPAMLVNDVLFESLTPDAADKILSELPADPKDFRDPTLEAHDGAGTSR
jgi:NADH-quinone oxidoreductase E subunit